MKGLITIAALPTTAGSGSALIPERNPSRPRFELTPDDMAAAGYPVAEPEIGGYWSERQSDGSYAMGYTLSDGTKTKVGTARVAGAWVAKPTPFVHLTIDAADVESPSQLRRIVAEAAARTCNNGDSVGNYSYEADGLVRIGDAAPMAKATDTWSNGDQVQGAIAVFSSGDPKPSDRQGFEPAGYAERN